MYANTSCIRDSIFRRFLIILALSGLSAPSHLVAQNRSWTVEDALGLRSAGQASLSPDNQQVVFVVSQRDLEANKNQSDLWLVPTTGNAEPTQLTRANRMASAPAWAPDGRWIAFISDRGGSRQVYGISVTGGEAWRITDWETGVNAFRISPDGKKIAFTARAKPTAQDRELEKLRGRPMVWDSAYAQDWVHLWIAPLENREAGTAMRSSPDGLSVGTFIWAPDSRALAWSGSSMADESTFPSRNRQNGMSRESDLFIQDRAGGPHRRVTSMRGGVSPVTWVEGIGLLASSSGQELGTYNQQLWSVEIQGGTAPVSLTSGLDESASFVAITPQALLVEALYRTGRRLYRIPLRNGRAAGKPERVSDDHLFYSGFSTNSAKDHVAFIANGPNTAPNVYVSATAKFAPRRLTDLNPQVAELPMGEQRVVSWKSAADGEEIEGVLTLPVGYRRGDRVPLLLIIHGGPSAVSSNTFNSGGRYSSQVFASLGYASLQPNYRGSSGYGERFRGLNRGDISGRDWVDVNSGVDYLISQGIADPDRLGIMGWSFGGHHTFWGITQTNRFKAASAGAGATDLISMYSQTDLPGFYHTYLGPKPWEDFKLYEERSAYRFVDRVSTPLLIQVGERDVRVPADQSIQFYEAMSALGKAPVSLVLYPGQGHGIQDVALTRDMMARNIAWFTRWIPVRAIRAELSATP